ncbi:type IV secretory system conjugative DNA transfer family protein [Microbacterium sp. YY-01]|uniref:type IV secretory system conjugative DNA transfer family protein n=1 Tax=Microbacterium sp. YY-01 TaxID=3421634 RepID=UPI003D16315C
MNHRGEQAFVYVAGTLAAAALSLWVATSLAVRVSCGQSPKALALLGGFRAIAGDLPTTETGCTTTQITVILCFVGMLVSVIALGVIGWELWVRWRESDTKLLRDLRYRVGFARTAELRKQMSTTAVARQGTRLRPGVAKLRKPQAHDVAWCVGKSRGIPLWVSVEESVVLLGPPRSGKGFRVLINAILDWPGPLVTTSTTTDNLRVTKAHRARLGRVLVFDPQKLSGEEHPIRISPITGCEDPLVATQRAAVLIAGAGMVGGQNEEWAEQAKSQLASLLCAAALGGFDVEDLARWGSAPQMAMEAVDALSSNPHAPSSWAASLANVIEGDPRLLGNIWFGVSGAVAPLRIPEIAEAMMPRPGEPVFDPLEFLSGQNTLYLIGTKTGSGAAGGYLAAILDDIVETARRKALASPESRIDPPLGLILDEIANMFVWPQLPNVMSDGGGRGICPIVVLQSRKQAEVVWSAAGMHAIFGAATVKIQLGGSSDNDFLGEIQALAGQRATRRQSKSYSEQGVGTSVQQEKEPLIGIDEIRRMPQSLGLLIAKNLRPVLLDLQKWTDRKDARSVQSGRKQTELAQQLVFSRQQMERNSKQLVEVDEEGRRV